MNSNIKHGELSSAIQSPKQKTDNRINSPSDVFHAIRFDDLIERTLCDTLCKSVCVLFGNKSVLSKNLARSSAIRLRALLFNACGSTEIIFKIKN